MATRLQILTKQLTSTSRFKADRGVKVRASYFVICNAMKGKYVPFAKRDNGNSSDITSPIRSSSSSRFKVDHGLKARVSVHSAVFWHSG